MKTGTQRNCNELFPIMFKIHDSWFQWIPKLLETVPPINVQLLTHPTWKYVKPAFFATSRIYSNDDLDLLWNCRHFHIMFPVEKPSMMNTITRKAMRYQKEMY